MIPFFVRRYNDIDHVAPVVYRFAQHAPGDVVVLCNEPAYDITTDPRLQLLARMGVTVDYTIRYGADTPLHRAVASALCGPEALLTARRGAHALVAEHAARRRLFTAGWAKRLLTRLAAPVAVFDWAKPRQHVTGALLDAAQALGIPTVGLPHGLKLWTEESMAESDFRQVDYAGCFQFDAVVVPNALFGELFARGGIPRERLHVLGSARFCDEWVRVLHALPAGKETRLPAAKAGDLKLVFMEGGHRYLTAPDVMVRAINRIAQMPGVKIVVKPKTASSGLDLTALDPAVEVVASTPSVDLCRWADAVIVTCTSVVFEAYAQAKTVIYPRYFYTKSMVLETMDAAWCPATEDALIAAIAQLTQDRRVRPYTDAAVKRMLAELVYAGDEQRSVLDTYHGFIGQVQGRLAMARGA